MISLMIDNTGLHSFGRCLDKNVTNLNVDLLDFFNLIVEIIFSDNIYISSFEKNNIYERTQYYISVLENTLSDSSHIQIKYLGDECFDDAVNNTICKIKTDIDYFWPSNELNLSAGWSEIGKPANEYIDEFHKFITKTISCSRVREEQDKVRYKRSLDASKHLLLCDEELLLLVQHKIKQDDSWSNNKSGQLDIILRHLLNEEISSFHNSYYAPAIKRSILLRERNAYIIDVLQKLSIERHLNQELLQNLDLKKALFGTVRLPAIINYLIDLSKGNPVDLLYIAIELKEKVIPIKKVLSKHIKNINSNDRSLMLKSEYELNDLSKIIMAEALSLKKEIGFADLLDFTLMPPFVSLNLRKLIDYINYYSYTKKICVLTEISKYNLKQIKANSNSVYLNSLIDQCLKS